MLHALCVCVKRTGLCICVQGELNTTTSSQKECRGDAAGTVVERRVDAIFFLNIFDSSENRVRTSTAKVYLRAKRNTVGNKKNPSAARRRPIICFVAQTRPSLQSVAVTRLIITNNNNNNNNGFGLFALIRSRPCCVPFSSRRVGLRAPSRYAQNVTAVIINK